MATSGLDALTQDQRDIVERCLRAAVEGPFFPDWEFHTLMGLHRADMAQVLTAWPQPVTLEAEPGTPADEIQRRAVNGALNMLLGYPHHDAAAWRDYIRVDPYVVAETLRLWRGDDEFDESAKGLFNRLT